MATQIVTRNGFVDPLPAVASFVPRAVPSVREMADWLDAAVQRAKSKYQRERELEERKMQEEALKKRLGSQFWQELAGWLQAIEGRFNTRFGAAVLSVTLDEEKDKRVIRILARPIRSHESIAELEYQNGTDYMELSIGSGGGAGTARIVNFVLSGGAALAEFGAEDLTWEQLGQKLIEDLLD